MASCPELNEDQLAVLEKAFGSVSQTKTIAVGDVKDALQALGTPLAGYEVRELIGNKKGDLTIDELTKLFAQAQNLKDKSKDIRKSTVLKEAIEVVAIEKKDGSGDAKHTVSRAEERGFTSWINARLARDPDCADLVPINSDVDGQLYDRCADGILLCKLINLAVPKTIDERTINKGTSLRSVFKVNENLTLMVNSAAAIGCCVVNIGPEDISNKSRHLVLGLIWQFIRKCLVDTITLANHSELVALLREGEDPEVLKRLRPEELLMRWANYHLEKAGTDRRLTNFNEDVHDSVIYAYLMKQIAPADKAGSLIPVEEIVQGSSNLETRATKVLDNAKRLNAGHLLTPEDIYLANERGRNQRDKLNLGFVATLFNLYPGLEKPAEAEEIEPETLEEKSYKNWMNSLGVDPYVNHLYTGLSSGVALLQLEDKIRPGTVNWSRVVTKFTPKKRLFEEQGNCNLVLEYGKVINVRFVNLSGEDIRNGEKKLVLGACFLLMRAYTFKLLRQVSGPDEAVPCEDKEILAWTNAQLTSVGEPELASFRDPALATGRPVLAVLEAIGASHVDRSSVLTQGDNYSNCLFAISQARKSGARVYALPEHLVQLHGKMILTVFVCLMVLHYRRKSFVEVTE